MSRQLSGFIGKANAGGPAVPRTQAGGGESPRRILWIVHHEYQKAGQVPLVSRYSSMQRAASIPSATAQAISDCPLLMSPAEKIPSSEVM